MRSFSRHERRWGSDSVPVRPISSAVSSPALSWAGSSEEEFVEVTLDFQGDYTVILRSVEPAVLALGGAAPVCSSDKDSVTPDGRDPTPRSASASSTRSPSMCRSSSHRLRQFSQELKAEAFARAKQLSHDLRAELRRFSWSHGSHASKAAGPGASTSAGATAAAPFDSAHAARALRKQRAQLNRTRSGAHKALRGLRFISGGGGKTSSVDAWNEVQASFERLAKEG